VINNLNVPVFILAGGAGTRLSEETSLKPKPMVTIGEYPILLHIMRWYYAHGFNDFVICAGYRAWDIKEFFLSYEFRQNDFAIDHRISTNAGPAVFNRNTRQENWRVLVIDTGRDTMTGGRVARALDEVGDSIAFTEFALTYGDGVSNVNLTQELEFHRQHKRIGTVLGVPPPARFGELGVDESDLVQGFVEKPEDRQGLVNGGFFFFSGEFRRYLSTDESCILEQKPLADLAHDGGLMVHRHSGFWQPMDTLRDRNFLQSIWESGKAPWLPSMARTGETVAA
jgi:glucose-1-phosphate cytidylyltransferase